MFNEYGVGTEEENCGMLFVFAIQDRKYGFEIGDGFAKRIFLREDLETDFVDNDIKTDLRAENYDSAILKIVQHLEGLMTDEENGVYAYKEADKNATNQAKADEAIALIKQIGTVEYTDECRKAINAARSKYFWLSSDQKALVTNYHVLEEAGTEYNALKNAAIMAVMKNIGIVLCIICPIIAIVVLIINYRKRQLHKRKVLELCDRYYKHLKIAEIDETEFISYFEDHCSDKRTTDDTSLENELFELLYKCYVVNKLPYFATSNAREENLELYIQRFENVNNLKAFKNCKLVSTEDIVREIDKKEDEKARIKKENIKIVNQFFEENKHRILKSEIAQKVKERLMQYVNTHHIVSNAELESVFDDALNELSFEVEFAEFCEEYARTLDMKDFDRNEFYRSVRSSDNYYSYRATRRYDRSWMLPLLMMHVSQQKQQRLKRERQEKEHRRREEQRRREEKARKELERINSYNSSFGSRLGRGHSSGGGFSGGW